MKTPITDIKQLIGQTVTGVARDTESLFIATETGLMVLHSPDVIPPPCEYSVLTWQCLLCNTDFRELALKSGAVTQQDLTVLQAEMEKEMAETSRKSGMSREINDRAEYARLKAKFEPEGGK